MTHSITATIQRNAYDTASERDGYDVALHDASGVHVVTFPTRVATHHDPSDTQILAGCDEALTDVGCTRTQPWHAHGETRVAPVTLHTRRAWVTRSPQPDAPPADPRVALIASWAIAATRHVRGPAECDFRVATQGIAPYGDLNNEIARLANHGLPTTDEIFCARRDELWQEVRPELEVYAQWCATLTFTGWSNASWWPLDYA